MDFPCVVQAALNCSTTACNLYSNVVNVTNVTKAFVTNYFTGHLGSQGTPSLLFIRDLVLLPPTVTFLLPYSARAGLVVLILYATTIVVTISFLGLVLMPSVRVEAPATLANGIVTVVSSLAVYTRPLKRVLCK